MNHILHPEADAEFQAHVRHYHEVDSELGSRFYDVVAARLREATEHPKLYRVYDPPARRVLVPDFPYAVLYVPRADYVLIVAVMHLKQRPGYWRHRLTD